MASVITAETTSSRGVISLLQSNDIVLLPQHGLKIPTTNLIPAVCFYNGSFAPIHAGHLNVLEEAKQYIDNLGTHELIAAYISPSHSDYVMRKLSPEECISTGHRLAMIQLALKNLDWVMIDLFETFQPHHTSLCTIMKKFISRIRSQLPNAQHIDVFWLKGEDALRFPMSENLLRQGYHSLYVLNREFNKNETHMKSSSQLVQDPYLERWQKLRQSSSYPDRYN